MFIFNEDRAMKTKFEKLVVEDINAPTGRPVKVIWLDPDTELTNLTFPCVVINNTGITYDAERASNGFFQLQYSPESFAMWSSDSNNDVTNSPYWAMTPIPYNINYQIEVLARNNKHATFLTAVLSGLDFLHARYGYLAIPEDGTVRRMDLTSGPERLNTKDKDGKRIFHTAYSVNVSTELLPPEIDTYNSVRTVVIDASNIPPIV